MKTPPKPVDHKATLALVKQIDNDGTRLTKGQIDFIAGIIDGKQKEFSPKEAARVRRIYERKVVNGKPDDYDV
jgi:hypothetical protein